MNVVFSFNVIIEHRYGETQRFKIDNVGWRLKKCPTPMLKLTEVLLINLS